jgi:hypothetical protein
MMRASQFHEHHSVKQKGSGIEERFRAKPGIVYPGGPQKEYGRR